MKCAGIRHLDQPCKLEAKWFVWHASCGPLYTFACDKHLAARILAYSDGPDRVSQIDNIETIAIYKKSHLHEV